MLDTFELNFKQSSWVFEYSVFLTPFLSRRSSFWSRSCWPNLLIKRVNSTLDFSLKFDSLTYNHVVVKKCWMMVSLSFSINFLGSLLKSSYKNLFMVIHSSPSLLVYQILIEKRKHVQILWGIKYKCTINSKIHHNREINGGDKKKTEINLIESTKIVCPGPATHALLCHLTILWTCYCVGSLLVGLWSRKKYLL